MSTTRSYTYKKNRALLKARTKQIDAPCARCGKAYADSRGVARLHRAAGAGFGAAITRLDRLAVGSWFMSGSCRVRPILSWQGEGPDPGPETACRRRASCRA